SIFQRTEYKTPQKRTRTIINTRVRFWARFMWVMHLDHHLTTPSSPPVPYPVFYVTPFFYNHPNQRRKLCVLHNSRRWFIIFPCPSQFSDSKGQRFESPRPHHGECSYSI